MSKKRTKDNFKSWYLDWISEVIEDFILLELERSSTSKQLEIPVERKYLKEVRTYVEHRCGYNAEIKDDSGDMVPIVISWR